jgi:Mg-chelatase subunit ChlD
MIAAAFVALAALPSAAAQVGRVDAAVVLLVDASGSMTEAELAMARGSHASALTSREVLSAITGGEHGRIAIAYVEFADRPQTRIGWTVIDSVASASAFAEVIAQGDAPIPGSMTGLGVALAAADALFDALPYRSSRLVVDVVGDGRNNLAPHTIVGRRSLLSRGAVINALPLMLSPDDDRIDVYFAGEVAGGPGHFIVPITAIDAMPTALRSKIVLELY